MQTCKDALYHRGIDCGRNQNMLSIIRAITDIRGSKLDQVISALGFHALPIKQTESSNSILSIRRSSYQQFDTYSSQLSIHILIIFPNKHTFYTIADFILCPLKSTNTQTLTS